MSAAKSAAIGGLCLFTIAFHGLLACEQRFSANPPFAPESSPAPSSASVLDTLRAPSTDAGLSAPSSDHAMAITLCSSSPQSCQLTVEDASLGESYLVVFGSGGGSIRSRSQAMADLYKELRDRSAARERLDAELHARGDAGAPAAPGGSVTPKKASGDLLLCAVRLLELADGVGELTLDVVHESGSKGCMLSIGRFVTDGGAAQCLIQEPEHPRSSGLGGISF